MAYLCDTQTLVGTDGITVAFWNSHDTPLRNADRRRRAGAGNRSALAAAVQRRLEGLALEGV